MSNQAKADEGQVRVAMILALGGMSFVALSIPNAFAADGNAAAVPRPLRPPPATGTAMPPPAIDFAMCLDRRHRAGR